MNYASLLKKIIPTLKDYVPLDETNLYNVLKLKDLVTAR